MSRPITQPIRYKEIFPHRNIVPSPLLNLSSSVASVNERRQL